MIYAVGDIHGQHHLLCALLEILIHRPLHVHDTLIFLGDYIDRGDDSCGVVETLIKQHRRRCKVVFLRGNHEQMMLDAQDGPPPNEEDAPGFLIHSPDMINWLQNGGVDTLISYEVEDFAHWQAFVPDKHWRFLRETQMEYMTERYHFVHAGLLLEGERWEGTGWDIDPRLWIREPFLSNTEDYGGRRVIFGHTPQHSGRPLILPNKIGIDTGAAYGGPLTAVALDETGEKAPEFIQVSGKS